MSKLSANLEEAWKFMDWDRIIGSIYLMIKEVDKLEERNEELEKQHESDNTLYWVIQNQNNRLKARIKELEGMVTNK